jgi:hypothetical protein
MSCRRNLCELTERLRKDIRERACRGRRQCSGGVREEHEIRVLNTYGMYGADVTFLVRERRRAALAAEGLRIESPFGDAKITARTVIARDLAPTFDAVILDCKAYDLDEAVEPAFAPEGYVLPFLNGIAHVDELNARFGKDAFLAARRENSIDAHAPMTRSSTSTISLLSRLESSRAKSTPGERIGLTI